MTAADVLIALFGIAALGFGVLVVMLRQPMRSALALIAHMVCLAAIYAALSVHVVALFQILIYVGAVMVFMVYTIMLLDDRDASYQQPFARTTTPALVIAVLVASLLFLLFGRPAPDATTAASSVAAAPAVVSADAAGAVAPPFAFNAFSVAFMKHYWFHFELATVLLLVGIVAAWTVIKENDGLTGSKDAPLQGRMSGPSRPAPGGPVQQGGGR